MGSITGRVPVWCRAVLCTAVGALAFGPVAAAEPASPAPPASPVDVSGRTVVVSTKPLEPFVFIAGEGADGDPVTAEQLRGYSIDVWNEVADRRHLDDP